MQVYKIARKKLSSNFCMNIPEIFQENSKKIRNPKIWKNAYLKTAHCLPPQQDIS